MVRYTSLIKEDDQPTGKAMVVFHSPELAKAAIAQLQNSTLEGR